MVLQTKLLQFSNFAYTAGQGGTPVYASPFSVVQEAAVVGVAPQTLNSLATGGVVTAIGSTVPNEITILLYTIGGGTVTEIATGTYTGTVSVMVTGA